MKTKLTLSFLFSAVVAAASFAETAAANGGCKGGNAGSWGTPTNWKGDALPTTSARFWPSNDQTIDVMLDNGDYSAGSIARAFIIHHS